MDINKEDYLVYKEYAATDRQREILQACYDSNGQNPAAVKLGCSRSTVKAAVRVCRDRAMKQGYIPEIGLYNGSPDETLPLKGASVYRRAKFDEMGNEVEPAHWAKFDRKQQAEDDFKRLMQEYEEKISKFQPLPRVKSPKKSNKDLLAVLPLGDPHIGMYSWHKETGEDFDCDIAERNLINAFMLLMDKIPDTEVLMILNLGDFFHSDSPSNRTERGGNALDVDGRWFRVLMIGLEILIQCVDLALKKHKKVIIRNNAGNHDPQTAKVLCAALMQTYRKNPRVEVIQPENDIMFFEFGRNMISSSHGHFFKAAKAPSIMATYEPEMWGRTQHRFFFYGHIHHKNVKEDGGVVTESFNTLAARDAWHHASGYLSQRQSEALVFHKDDGLIERHIHTLRRG